MDLGLPKFPEWLLVLFAIWAAIGAVCMLAGLCWLLAYFFG
jgi:hypothetical protein